MGDVVDFSDKKRTAEKEKYRREKQARERFRHFPGNCSLRSYKIKFTPPKTYGFTRTFLGQSESGLNNAIIEFAVRRYERSLRRNINYEILCSKEVDLPF